MTKIIKSYREAKEVAADETVLIEVPGEFARALVWLVHMLKNPDQSQAGVLVRQLLTAAKGPPE